MKVDRAAPSSRGASSGTRRPASRCRPTAGRRRGRPCRSAGRRRPAPCRRSRRRASGSISMWIVSAGVARDRRASPCASLMQPADLALDLRRRERKPLVGAPRADAERRRLPIAEIVEDRRRQRVEVVRRRGRRSEKLAMPNTRRNAIARPRPTARPAPSSISIRPITDRTLDDVEAGQRRPQVADEHLDEPRPVPPLERQLLVVNDDRVHAPGERGVGGPVSAAHGALDRSGQAGVDPVAGQDTGPAPPSRRRAAPAARAPARTSRAARG